MSVAAAAAALVRTIDYLVSYDVEGVVLDSSGLLIRIAKPSLRT